jgi:hypothetical protein
MPGDPPMTTSAYAVLGVCPDSEDVVIRAAYRALMQKYTSLARLHEDFGADDRRAREVQAAYDAIEAARREPEPTPDLLFAPSPAPVEVAEAPPEPEPVAPLAHAPRPRSGIAALIAFGLVVAAGGAAAWWALRSEAPLNGAERPSLQVRLHHGQAAAAPISRPLPCYVGGRSVGDLRLADCAARNGVASGPLEVGLAPPLPPPRPAPVPPPVVAAAAAPPPPVTVSADASAGHVLWRSAKAAALRFAARSLAEEFRAEPPAPRRAVRHRPEPARQALAKLDTEIAHPLKTLMRAVKAAPPEGVYAVQHFLEPPEPPAPARRRPVQPSPPSAEVLVPIAGRPAAP